VDVGSIKKMVDLSLPKTINMSSPKIKIISYIKTKSSYRNEAFLKQKYEVERLSARQIAILIGCGHSTINTALEKMGLKKERRFSGHVPYGYKMVFGKRVEHTREQNIIKQMTAKYEKGWSGTKIASWLDERKIKPPASEKNWYSGTVLALIRREQQGIKIVSP
jgi:hypothetical protein